MSSVSKYGVLYSLAAFVVTSLAAGPILGRTETATPVRLSHQTHNRMIYIETEGQPAVFVDIPNHYDVGSPSISPDGTRIVFDANTVGMKPERETWLVNTDGTGLRKLLDGATPRWSPDGKRLSLTRQPEEKPGEGENPVIYEFDIGTKKKRKLCPGRFGDWSPDGKQLVFAREGKTTPRGGTHYGSKLFIAHADGSEAKEFGDGDWPSWSPDGKKIACCMHEQKSTAILWVIDVASKARERLAPGYYRPQWAGDSKSVFAKGMLIRDDGKGLLAPPARIFLDKSRIEFFHMDLDNPWAPCVSRDGKTLVLVVDSEKRREAGRK